MALQADIDLGVVARGPKGERGPVEYTYEPYIADDGNWHIKLLDKLTESEEN